MSHRPISGQFNQVATRFGVKEATANHAMTRVAAELIRKRRIRILKESGYMMLIHLDIFGTNVWCKCRRFL
jgi:hypothetical protein